MLVDIFIVDSICVYLKVGKEAIPEGNELLKEGYIILTPKQLYFCFLLLFCYKLIFIYFFNLIL